MTGSGAGTAPRGGRTRGSRRRSSAGSVSARSVLNVGAGTGSYEPGDREVTAVEPSAVMIAQRPAGSAPVIQAAAEALPLADDSVDAAMAIVSDHHWTDRAAGLAELRRVARDRVVLVNVDPATNPDLWLLRDYLLGFFDLVPEPYRQPGHWEAELRELLGGEVAVEPIAVPTTAATASCSPTGGAPRPTSTRRSGKRSRSSSCCPRTK